MKKSFLFSILLFSLVGCSNTRSNDNNDSEVSQSTSSIHVSNSIEINNSSTSASNEQNDEFSKGVFKNHEYTLTVKNAEVIKSPSEDKEGLYVTYELTNNSDHNIHPEDSLDWLELTQETDTSLAKLDANYYELDAFGDDTDTYNEMVERSNSQDNLLLPGKTIVVYRAYNLEDKNKPVKFTAYSPVNDQYVGHYDLIL